MLLLEVINAMAVPAPFQSKAIYFHGTRASNVDSILHNGIRPQRPSKSRWLPSQKPIGGMIYMTPEFSRAYDYALSLSRHENGVFKYGRKTKGFAYVFVISGQKLKDIYPDEDVIAHILVNDPDFLKKYVPENFETLSPARVAKQLVRSMPEVILHRVMKKYPQAIAHRGKIFPDGLLKIRIQNLNLNTLNPETEQKIQNGDFSSLDPKEVRYIGL